MKDLKKILIFSTAYYPLVGGAEVAIKEITDRITGLEFDLITARMDYKLPKFEKVGKVNVYRIGFGWASLDKILLPFLGSIKALILDQKRHYSSFWCVMITFASGAAYVSNLLKFWRRVPIVLTIQEGDSEEHLNKRWFGMINLAWRLALGRSQKVTVLSQYLKNRVIKFGYKKEVAIIPNGIDMIKFGVELSLDEKNKIRKDLGFLETDLVLVTTSRLVVKNGVADIIKSLNFLPTHTKLVILGDGFLKQKLISLVNEFDLNQRVVFLGYQDQSQMIKIMKASDIFIRPSLSEGFGNSFIEAMALKLPVIATPVGGIVDYLKDGETGYFCKPENPKSISEVVQRVVDDVSENHVIENAYQMVNREYNWDKIAEKMNKIFIYE